MSLALTGMAIVLTLAVFGLVASIFFGTMVVQLALQRHMHLLQRRAEAVVERLQRSGAG